MKIKNLTITNFRLLKNISLSLEEKSTVIVGRNNSGKTSLTEIFRRLFSDKTPSFNLYDFNISSIDSFRQALILKLDNKEQDEIREVLPAIEIKFTIAYNKDLVDLGILGDFVIDLNPDCNDVLIIVRYQLQNGKINHLFENIADATAESITLLNKQLKEKIPQLYEVVVITQDPNDASNSTKMEYSKFRQLIGIGFINAQRGLDDVTHTEKDVLGKVLAKLLKTAKADSAPEDMKEKSEALQVVINDIQKKVDTDFNQKLDDLLPALRIFGYPGLADPQLSTETTLDISNILDSHTKIRYSQGNGIFLPETYNGLGSRNLIYMLFQLFEFFRDWQSRPISNNLYVVFIEEPEAHLHPQMQQVFIKQINEIALEFSNSLNKGVQWPVQFIVTTHSTHIANEAKFETIRYFLTTRGEKKETKVKDLRMEFSDPGLKEDKEFLHKYMTLTKCDLYFADKAILIEGPTERIIMPVLQQKVDAIAGNSNKLLEQYISTIEVGGAYAHHFYKFLDFLELRTLVITDLDSVVKTEKEKKDSKEKTTTYDGCDVAKGTHSSNAAIKNWFQKGAEGHMLLSDCLSKTPEQKTANNRRIAFQIPETKHTCCARSFEDAFMLANSASFGLVGNNDDEKAQFAYLNSPKNNEKTNFALKFALDELNWNPPKYIIEGLLWLGQKQTTTEGTTPANRAAEAVEVVVEAVAVAKGDVATAKAKPKPEKK